jgi:hypothetical protein
VQVEIDIYSGRPNPNWELPAEAAAGLMARIAALPAAAPWTAPDQLGYRGTIVRSPSNRLFHRIDVYRGLVKVELVDKSIKWHRDEHRTIEEWLLQGAPASELPAEEGKFIAETIKVDP